MFFKFYLKVFLSLFLILSLNQNIYCSTPATFPRFSSIEILPYDSSKFIISEEIKPPTSISPYREQHYRGITFDYTMPSSGDLLLHHEIMKQLKVYTEHETFADLSSLPNTLLVRLKFYKYKVETIEEKESYALSNSEPVEFWMGGFTSGQEADRADSIDTLKTKLKEFAKENGLIGLSDALISCTEKNIHPFTKKVRIDPNDHKINMINRYTRQVMKFNISSVKSLELPFLSRATYIDDSSQKKKRANTITSQQYKEEISKRLFCDLVTESDLSHPEELIKSQKRLMRLEARERLTHALFLRPCHVSLDGRKACLNEGFYDCFSHSESCFLLGLCYEPKISDIIERTSVENLEQGSDGILYKYQCIIDMYSYRDICINCRGMFSMILKNGELKGYIERFMEKQQNDSLMLMDDIKIYAHSTEQNNM